jgi:hypothetical protein
MRNEYKFLAQKCQGKWSFGRPNCIFNDNTSIKYSLREKQGVEVWTRFNWLITCSNVWFLWIQSWYLVVRWYEIPLPTERLIFSRNTLFREATELFSYYTVYCAANNKLHVYVITSKIHVNISDKANGVCFYNFQPLLAVQSAKYSSVAYIY